MQNSNSNYNYKNYYNSEVCMWVLFTGWDLISTLILLPRLFLPVTGKGVPNS